MSKNKGNSVGDMRNADAGGNPMADMSNTQTQNKASNKKGASNKNKSNGGQGSK